MRFAEHACAGLSPGDLHTCLAVRGRVDRRPGAPCIVEATALLELRDQRYLLLHQRTRIRSDEYGESLEHASGALCAASLAALLRAAAAGEEEFAAAASALGLCGGSSRGAGSEAVHAAGLGWVALLCGTQYEAWLAEACEDWARRSELLGGHVL